MSSVSLSPGHASFLGGDKNCLQFLSASYKEREEARGGSAQLFFVSASLSVRHPQEGIKDPSLSVTSTEAATATRVMLPEKEMGMKTHLYVNSWLDLRPGFLDCFKYMILSSSIVLSGIATFRGKLAP